MKALFFSIIILSTSCVNPNCDELKEEIQNYFEKEDYEETIKLFRFYRGCSEDDLDYLYKLGLLYHNNGQESESKKTFDKLFKLHKEKQELSENELSLLKISVYALQSKHQEALSEISKLDVNKLTPTQKEELAEWKFFLNPGEFLGMSYQIEFKLFD